MDTPDIREIREIPEGIDDRKKGLVIYSYHSDNDDSYQNLQDFLKHVHIHAGHSKSCAITCCIVAKRNELLELDGGIHVIIVRRENDKGYNFGAYQTALCEFEGVSFDYYMFIDSTCAGPFYPSWTKNVNAQWHWIDPYLVRLKKEDISLVCSSMEESDNGDIIVDSYAFAVDRQGLELLVKSNPSPFIQHADQQSVVEYGEKLLSSILLDNGLNIDCLRQCYKGIDWRQRRQRNGNKHKVKNTQLPAPHPFETIFFKDKEGASGVERQLQDIRRIDVQRLGQWSSLDPNMKERKLDFPSIDLLDDDDTADDIGDDIEIDKDHHLRYMHHHHDCKRMTKQSQVVIICLLLLQFLTAGILFYFWYKRG
jgi:hypothetical protein